LCVLFLAFKGIAQERDSIKVHFLYGSKPKKEYKKVERKWFGGVLGGHVGIENKPDTVFNFLPAWDLHIFAQNDNIKGKFMSLSTEMFWGIFGSPIDEVKTATLIIPVSKAQKIQLDSIFSAYIQKTPYDYAFFGMRCGSSTYEILAQIGILKSWSYRKIYRRIFYPRRLRKRLFKKAKENNWKIIRQEGTNRRKWERDTIPWV